MSRISPGVVTAVTERAAGYCEACGFGLGPRGDMRLGPALHHRLKLSQGGGHGAENLMLVHHECHNGASWSIHGRDGGARSYRLGHMVRRGTDPASVQVIVVRNLREVRA